MKKIIFLLILCFPGIVELASSQPYLGVSGGIASSKLSGDSPDKALYKGLMAFSFGANLDLKLARSVYLSLQPTFSQEGTRVFFNVPNVYEPVDSVHIRLNYFSFPVLLKASSANQRFYAIGGVEAAYMIGSKVKISDYSGDLDEHITRINLAVIFGAGMRIPIGRPRLVIELRYSQGIVNLTDEAYIKSYLPRVKTSSFRLNVGLEIPLTLTDPQN